MPSLGTCLIPGSISLDFGVGLLSQIPFHPSDALFFLTPCAFHSTSFVKEASRSHCGGDLNRTAISGARGTQGGRAGFDALGSGL